MDKIEDSNYINIGKLVATHGLTGELVLKHALGKKTAFKNVNAIFIKDKSGQLIPWFLKRAKIKTESETYIQLEEVTNIDQAKFLTRKDVWLTRTDFDMHCAAKAPISLLGFMLMHGEKQLGAVEEIIQQPHQLLCTTHINGKEVLIPLHEETLKQIDDKNKIIQVELPEGLLDVYLS